MRRGFLFAVAFAGLLHAVPAAQQATTNINVLPAHVDPADPSAFLKGDLFMQRQVEPAMAASTRNPDHLMVFYNDYRAVDIGNDFGVGEQVASRSILARLLARVFRLPRPERTRTRAAAEAFVGYSVSYDRGVTWSGGLIPGSPKDLSAASLASPIRGVEAATDPVVASAPCGYIYVAYVGFTRGPGGKSYLAVSRYQDRNNTENGDDIQYLDTKVLATASNDNPTLDTFVDKPSIGIDIDGPGSTSEACHHHAYVAYTVFDGPETSAGFKSRIMVARSPDSGGSWLAPVNVSGAFAQNQGAAVAVTPSDDPGHIYVAWRQFKPGENAIVLAKSHNFGETWDPAAIISGSPLAAFDQPSIGKPEPAFRTNGFPTLAVASNGRVFAAWQERVGFADCASNGPLCGRPAVNGSPRIVLMRSIDQGATWTDDRGAVGKRRAVDFGDRCEAAVQPGFGTVGCRASGPQVMPRLSTGAGRLMLTFYEARGELSGPAPGFIAGLNRRVDFRYAQLNASNGRLIAGAQVSRYDIRADANLADGEDETDLVQVAAGIPAVNRTNGLTSNAGTQPFLGDYTDLIPPVQFVNTNAGWRFATTPRRAGGTGFFAAFGDNRYQVPPTTPAMLPVPDRYPFYSPPGTGMASCINPGSRNTDIITSQLSADLVVGAPVTFKELANIQRSFPIYVSNRSQELRFFRLTINRGVGIASFDQVTDLNVVDVAILPQSGVVRTVYVNPTRALTNAVSIEVDQIDAIGGVLVPGGLTGGITLNADPSTQPAPNPLVSNTETHNPLVSNNGAPLVSNYTVNPLVSNISKNNPLVSNPLVSNQSASAPLVSNSLPPDQDVYGITDVTWEVQNAGNTASSYLSLIDLPNGIDLQQFYKFQLTIFRRSYRATVDDTCVVTNVPYDQVIANVPNPLVSNDLSKNPLVSNPLVSNPLVSNSTFAEVPSSPAGQPGSTDGTTRAPRQPDRVFINLRGFKIVPQVPPDLVFGAPQNLPRLAVIAQERNIVNGIREEAPPAAYFAPDLALVAEAPPSFSPSTIVAGGAGELDGAVMANIGNAAAVVPNDAVINDRVFLSADNVLDATDIPLSTGASFGTLQPGQSVTIGARPVVIPPVPAGNYFILRQVDANLLVSESNERNNVSATPIVVLSGAGAGSLHFETQPRDGIANQPIVPAMSVRARDAQGAVIPGVAVRLLLNTGQLLDKTSVPSDVSGTAELVGQTTIVTDVSGLATFGGLMVNRPATGYTVVAAADGALSRTSALFDMIQPEAVSCGAASFSVSPRLAMGDDPRSVALGDFNGDGRPDIVTANRQSNDLSVRLGQPEGSFAEPAHVAVLSAPLGVAVADFNGDGFSDVFVISADSANILRGTPTGDLAPPTAVTISDGSASVTTGDFNQDGRADVAIAGTNGDGGGRVRIVLGNGSGGFQPQVTISLSADHPSAIKAADLNGDSRRDLVIANATAGTVEVLIGLPGGTFSEGSTYAAGVGPVALAIGDLNGDLRPDLVTSTSTGVAVLLAQPEGGFGGFMATSLGSDSRGVALGDFNGDGRLDVASANGEGFTLSLGDGGGGLLPPQPLDPNFEPRGLAAGDLDGDHRLDIVVVNGSPSNGVTILRNTCVPGPRTLVVTNTLDSGAGSLRQAILEANENPFADTIRFRIGAGGPKTIVPQTSLPPIFGPTTIDGTTQPGFDGAPMIEISNHGGLGNANGLSFFSRDNTVRGLAVNGFPFINILFSNFGGPGIPGGNNVIEGTYVGTNLTGTAVAGSNGIGIVSLGDGDRIGGSTAATRNVVSGNSGGIGVSGVGSLVEGNFVGTDATGAQPLPNVGIGISLTGAGHSIVRNVVSNNGTGINVVGSNHQLRGNLVGTDVTGTLARGNHNSVVLTNGATNVTIGGFVPADRNVIAANVYGVSLLTGSHGNFVQGNYIGTDITGQNALGNSAHGVHLQDAGTTGNIIGGPVGAARNVISGNLGHGVSLSTGGNTVQNNYIGLNHPGTGALANGAYGVFITNGASTVRDNVLSGNGLSGVGIAGASGNQILSNNIGTNAAGTSSVANRNGVNIFGGTGNAVTNNLVSGNQQYGILTAGNATIIRGNRVGTNVTGALPLGNGTSGFYGGIIAYSADNIIGGIAANEGNVVAANNGYGIALWGGAATRNVVQGNLVGTSASGLIAMGNQWGILLFNTGPDNQIGSLQVAGRNVISNNPQAGLGIYNTTKTLVQGNYIGTNITGTAAMPNGDGVDIVNSTLTTLGGTTPGAANVVASSSRYGMYIYQSSNNQVVGNRFGIGPTGTPLGNAEYGIVIGGTPPSNGNLLDSNLIAHNGAAGLFMSVGTNNVFRRNSIFSNAGLGIDIDGDGVTANDHLDPDGGPNGRVNFPILENAFSSGLISGQLRSTPNTPFTLTFYNNDTCDPSGNGEGATFITEHDVTTNADGNASFSVELGSLPPGTFVTATTTSTTEGTGEFSACRSVIAVEAAVCPCLFTLDALLDLNTEFGDLGSDYDFVSTNVVTQINSRSDVADRRENRFVTFQAPGPDWPQSFVCVTRVFDPGFVILRNLELPVTSQQAAACTQDLRTLAPVLATYTSAR